MIPVYDLAKTVAIYLANISSVLVVIVIVEKDASNQSEYKNKIRALKWIYLGLQYYLIFSGD